MATTSFVPDLDRPIPRRPFARRKTTARTITFVRNWDSDVSDGGLSFNQMDKSKDGGTDSDVQSISQRIASSPVPVVIASPRPVCSHLPVHNEVDEDGEELSNEDEFLPENNQSHRESIVFDEEEETIPDSYASSSNACSSPISPKLPKQATDLCLSRSSNWRKSIQSNKEQADTDKDSVSTVRSRHTSGRSNRSNNCASTSAASRRSLKYLSKLSEASQTRQTDDEQVGGDKESHSGRSLRHKSGRSNSSIASTSVKSMRSSYSRRSKVNVNSSQTRQTDDEQVDDDREPHSGRSLRHKSGRSHSSIASESVKSMRSSYSRKSKVNANSPQKMKETVDEQIDDDKESDSGRSSRLKSCSKIASVSTRSMVLKTLGKQNLMDASPQEGDLTNSGQSRTAKRKLISSGPGSTVSTHHINQSISSKSTRSQQLRLSSTESRKRPAHDKENIDFQNATPQAEVPESQEKSQTTESYTITNTSCNSDNVSKDQPAKRKKLAAPRASSQTESDDDVLPEETGYIVRLWQGRQKRSGVSNVLDLDIILNHFEEIAWEARQQVESAQVKKAINHFAKGVQSELREMIATVAKAKKVTRSLGRSEQTLNRKRKELLSVQHRLCAEKYNVAKLRHVLNNKPSVEED